MAFKERNEPIILSKLRILNKRLALSDEEKRYLSNLEKGYQGELQFDAMTETLTSNCLILNELLLEVEKATFQIDTLIIFADTLYVFEIKNNHGDYLYKQEGLTSTTTGASMKNPLDQLNRTKLLFKKLLNQLGYNFKLQGSVVFVNPEFTLYHAQPELPFIFPTQIKRLLNHLNNQPGKVSTNHNKLASKLVSIHQTDSLSNKLPSFHYDELKKGITCLECESFAVTASHKFLECDDCGRRELIESAVIRTVSELMILFPNKEITSNTIQEWCKVINSKKKIRRILLKNFDTKGSKQWRKYH
ncbi:MULTISPECIES: nuclease-related domain-containing protein [unclassified Mesobacillus]|uniref:nuclease-related domain-containing protein n=1 Tax=unclassified Mesobacillus TaxID=2675270 RepID=UPI00203B1715|nr:NERD domain-containing protein [Mesobacillus sp. MER 33]MCM3233432.1 NERD domain-containing protein [Mesobacillus sp. MER 48]